MDAFGKFYMVISQMIAKRLGMTLPSTTIQAEEVDRIRYAVKSLGCTSGKAAAILFLDKAYKGEFEELTPQIPRQAVEEVLGEFWVEYPREWAQACAALGLKAS